MTEQEVLIRQHRLEQFIYREVRLLDEGCWDEWELLFTPDGTYWAPAAVDQPDPRQHVSLIFEDALLRKVRQQRFKHPNAFSLQPFPRSSHLVSNVMVDSDDEQALVVSARFLMHEYRRDSPAMFAGAYRYQLVRVADGFKIQQKKATLINCDGILNSSAIYF